MSDDTRERARQVADKLLTFLLETAPSDKQCMDAVTSALVNVARNERIRIADRADSLAHDYRHGTHSQDVFEGAARSGAARALEALAAELRVEGGGT